jgi:RNA polymerase sigma-70 factor (ECF subfamily)
VLAVPSMSRHPALTLSWVSAIFATVVAPARTEDPELLRQIAGGDRAALRTVYQRVAPRAMAVAMRILKDRAEAEDVVQETFVELWKRAARFDAERGTVNAWLVTMTRSRALDRLRARQSSARAVAGASNEPDAGLTQFSTETADDRRDRVRVAEALESLPTEQRQVIELAYFEGLTQSEIATRTGEPLGTVKTRVRLAMSKLAAVLANESEGAA